MNFGKLLRDRKIKKLLIKQEPDFSLAERDLRTAKNILEEGDYDWTYSIAYNAVLQSARTLMFSLGFKPVGSEQHKSVFEFLRETKLNKELINFFDKVRKKRNIVVYREVNIIEKCDVKEVIKKAEKFVQEIRTFVQKNRTGEDD